MFWNTRIEIASLSISLNTRQVELTEKEDQAWIERKSCTE